MEIMNYTLEELQEIRSNMVKEFEDANSGKQTSLAFAKNKISHLNASATKSEQVIVIGGSNLVKAIVEKVDGKIKVLSQESGILPVFKTKEIFLDFIATHLAPDVDRVGLNFAYHIVPVFRDGKLDGTLIKPAKEHTFDGLVNKNVGEAIEKYILETTGRKIDVEVANDTVCLVLSGLEKDSSISLVAGVIGTGFNFGFFIDDTTVVNLESGNFNNFPQSDTGKNLDNASVFPGYHQFEKEISGAYLYNHFNQYLKQLDHEAPEILSSAELSQIAQGDDEKADLARKVIKRSANLVAAQIAAIYDFKQKVALSVIIEGSLYWKGHTYAEMVHNCLEDLGVDTKHINIISVDNSSVIGAAHLIV